MLRTPRQQVPDLWWLLPGRGRSCRCGPTSSTTASMASWMLTPLLVDAEPAAIGGDQAYDSVLVCGDLDVEE